MSRIGSFGQISEVTDHLFLSGAGVLKLEKLRQKKISCIVNATIEEPSTHIPGIDYLRISIEDSPYAKIDQYFDIVADKIKAVKDRGGRTLVHCVAGVSRSATLCMIYLVKYERMTLRQAYHFVKSARPIIKPNIGFWRQMIDYERKLKGSSSVQMIETNQDGITLPDVYCSEFKRRLIQNHSSPKGICRNITITQVPFKYSQTSIFSRPLGSSYRQSTTPSLIPSIFSLPSRQQHSPLSMLTSTLSRRRSNDLFDNYHSSFSTF
ncbi:Dual specificity protein phosphatase [Dirofilaria immitis]|nr:Dual specificity protein phosphatase 14 [Dirofilaria immitis]